MTSDSLMGRGPFVFELRMFINFFTNWAQSAACEAGRWVLGDAAEPTAPQRATSHAVLQVKNHGTGVDYSVDLSPKQSPHATRAAFCSFQDTHIGLRAQTRSQVICARLYVADVRTVSVCA